MTLRRALRMLTNTRWDELCDVVSAQMALIGARILVWRRPVGQLLVPKRASRRELVIVPVHHRIEAARLAEAVQRASRHGLFRPRCLVRALALHRMIERRGIAGSTVRIGVRREGDALLAHAWVEHQGVVLGDTTSTTSAFTVLTDAQLPTHVEHFA